MIVDFIVIHNLHQSHIIKPITDNLQNASLKARKTFFHNTPKENAHSLQIARPPNIIVVSTFFDG